MDKRVPEFLIGWEADRVKVDGQEHYAVLGTIYNGNQDPVFGPVLDTMNCHHCLSIEDQEKVAKLAAAAPDLVDGINALLGLLQLLSHNTDVPEYLRVMMTNNHRIDEAKAALAKALGLSTTSAESAKV